MLCHLYEKTHVRNYTVLYTVFYRMPTILTNTLPPCTPSSIFLVLSSVLATVLQSSHAKGFAIFSKPHVAQTLILNIFGVVDVPGSSRSKNWSTVTPAILTPGKSPISTLFKHRLPAAILYYTQQSSCENTTS
jgi:hypothetical protein